MQCCLSIEVLFRLPLWQTAGMVASRLRQAGLDWPAPEASTPCRRQKILEVQIPYRRAEGALTLIVDNEASTAIGPRTMPNGIKVPGDGEWHARELGGQGRRQWRKARPAMDPATSDIRAVEFAPGRDGDSPVLPDPLDRVPHDKQVATATADGAHHSRRCHTVLIERGAIPVMPVRKTGRPWKDDGPAARVRTEPLRETHRHGRAVWTRRTGYPTRRRVEAEMRGLAAFGACIAAFAIVLGPCVDGSRVARASFGSGTWSVAAMCTASTMRRLCRAP